MNILIIINFIFTLSCVSFLTYKYFPYYLTWDKTNRKKKKCALVLWRITNGSIRVGYSAKSVFRISFRNIRILEMIEDAEEMSAETDRSSRQKLYAKFSWLKTIEEVAEFQKYYRIVNPQVVDNLVGEFLLKLK